MAFHWKFWQKETRSAGFNPYCIDSLYFPGTTSSMANRSLSAVFACVQLISSALSCMKFRVVRQDEKGHATTVKSDPLQRIFRNKAIQSMSMNQIVKNVMEDVLLRGNGFIFIDRGTTGVITQLRYIPASSMTIMYNQNTDVTVYKCPYLGNRNLDAKQVIHIKAVTREGMTGLSILAYAKNALEVAKAAEGAATSFFSDGCNISGILSPDHTMNEMQRNQMKASWDADKKSVKMLPFGIKYQSIGTTAQQSQLLESRQYEVIEICRFFGVNPHLIGDLSKTNYGTLEQENLQFLTYTLMPYIIQFEQEFSRKVFYDDDDMFVDVDENSYLMRADKSTTAEYLSKLVTSGIMSVNESRKELNLSDIGKDGDMHTIAYSDASKATLSNEKK